MRWYRCHVPPVMPTLPCAVAAESVGVSRCEFVGIEWVLVDCSFTAVSRSARRHPR